MNICISKLPTSSYIILYCGLKAAANVFMLVKSHKAVGQIEEPLHSYEAFFREKCEMQKVLLGDATLIAVACRTQGHALMLDSVRTPPIFLEDLPKKSLCTFMVAY